MCVRINSSVVLSFLYIPLCRALPYLLLPIILFITDHATAQNNVSHLTPAQQSAIEKYKKSAQTYVDEGDKNEAASYYNKIAFTYWEAEHLNEAIQYFKESLQLNAQIGNDNAIATINTNLGMLYAELRQFSTSLQHHREALAIRQQKTAKAPLVSALNNVAVALSNLDRFGEAVTELEEALRIAKELKDVKMIRSCYGMLSEYHQKLGNGDKSLEYYNLYSTLDKYLKEEQIKKIEEENSLRIGLMEQRARQVEAEKKATEEALLNKEDALNQSKKALSKSEQINQQKQMQIELLNKEQQLKESDLKAKEAQLKNEQLWRYFFIIGSLLLGLITFLSLRDAIVIQKKNKLLSKKNVEIEEQKAQLTQQRDHINKKNANITRSLNYAKRIQEAMLPALDELADYLPESFVLLKPKDIVSGDFYWFTPIAGQNKIVLTAVDCTGHGVPGAFMSMIGVELLNRIVNIKGIHSADKILEELHRGIRSALKQAETDNRDGMELSLCVIHTDSPRLEYAGAKSPLIYIQNGQLTHLQADQVPIGGIQKEHVRQFTNHALSIEAPTTVYMLSDGFQDQFGGEKGDKFLLANLKELLLQIHHKPMAEQKEILDQTIDSWKGDRYSQLDDILVIGCRVGGTNWPHQTPLANLQQTVEHTLSIS